MLYRPNTIFWIEDQDIVFDSGFDALSMDQRIKAAYGENPKKIFSEVMQGISDDNANRRIEEIIAEAGDEGAFVNVRTAQMGRVYLERAVPGAIICDSAFPLNGSVTIKWLQEHGMAGYPLVGLSSKTFDSLPLEMKKFFIGTSATYFCKNEASIYDLVTPLLFSQRYVQLLMQTQQQEGKK